MQKTLTTLALLGALSLTAAAAPPKVAPATAPVLKKAVAQRKGRVVIINFWATWCPPCRAEFPDMVAAQKKFAAQGVDLITLSMDDMSDLKEAQSFLEKNGITKGAFINKNGAEPDLGYFTWLEGRIPTSIAIPRTYVLDRKGNVTARLVGGQSAEQFETAIKSALAKK